MSTGAGIVESGLLLRPAVVGDVERWLEMLGDPDHRAFASGVITCSPESGPR